LTFAIYLPGPSREGKALIKMFARFLIGYYFGGVEDVLNAILYVPLKFELYGHTFI
jgi:hypothetical protein